ncbi:MAG: FAD-dependent monooxygenase, partial [Bacteroidota bacterium]
MIKTEVCIVGAGPGGAGAALQLAYQNIPSVLIDKATFPRDKICGDALSGKVVTVLNRMD